MELTAAVPREMQKPSSQLNKSIVEGADMELTAAVPRKMQKPSSQLNRSIVEGADMGVDCGRSSKKCRNRQVS